MRIGIGVGAGTGEDGEIGALLKQFERAEAAGFDSAWMANIFGLEALTSLAVAGSQVPGIELGTAVVPTYPRHPAVLAQQAPEMLPIVLLVDGVRLAPVAWHPSLERYVADIGRPALTPASDPQPSSQSPKP